MNLTFVLDLDISKMNMHAGVTDYLI